MVEAGKSAEPSFHPEFAISHNTFPHRHSGLYFMALGGCGPDVSEKSLPTLKCHDSKQRMRMKRKTTSWLPMEC